MCGLRGERKEAREGEGAKEERRERSDCGVAVSLDRERSLKDVLERLGMLRLRGKLLRLFAERTMASACQRRQDVLRA